ncbi:hypothetical protein MSTE_00416 [Mycobacteroides stephanolepidis]|uniref:Uncharacterized protein n=1 Tax=[Mycobacterium] stephanolepidis TaxID=1520670 RepID=A0A1Z4ES27_9MYCO|nr:hypothetical protein MSTE_00416 [[Mycobacterium] stephanolepidis]
MADTDDHSRRHETSHRDDRLDPPGREVGGQQTTSRQRVDAALAGRLSLQNLNSEEGAIFNAETEVELDRRIAAMNLQDELRKEGLRVAVLNEDGEIVTHPPA